MIARTFSNLLRLPLYENRNAFEYVQPKFGTAEQVHHHKNSDNKKDCHLKKIVFLNLF